MGFCLRRNFQNWLSGLTVTNMEAGIGRKHIQSVCWPHINFRFKDLRHKKRKVLGNNSQLKLYSAPQLSSAQREGRFDKEMVIFFTYLSWEEWKQKGAKNYVGLQLQLSQQCRQKIEKTKLHKLEKGKQSIFTNYNMWIEMRTESAWKQTMPEK